MTTDNIRAEFEKWADDKGYILTLEKRHHLTNSVYRLSHTQSAYEGWQTATASMQAENQRLREALEIVAKDNYFNDLSKLAANTVRKALNDTKQTTKGI